MSKVLIFGKNGQLARSLARSLSARQIPYVCIGSDVLDLENEQNKIERVITQSRISAVINAAAYTHVDGAETSRESAHAINAVAPGLMAKVCAARDLPFLHISTDYVFDGRARRPYKPSDKRAPVNYYGHSKAEGEDRVLAAKGQSVIIRTSWLYGSQGKNFVTTMLNAAKSKKSLSVVNDQYGRPTYTGHLAEACLTILDHMPRGQRVYHVQNTGKPISWYEFAKTIFKYANITVNMIPLSSDQYPTAAKRPAFSVLDVGDFQTDFKHHLLPWQTGLEQSLAEML